MLKQHNVFLSYSHKDKDWMEEVVTSLKPLSFLGMIDTWVDTRIKTGDDWFEEITRAIEQADIGIFLLSRQFLASEFINNEEIPALMRQRKRNGMVVISILARPCPWESVYRLNNLQIWQYQNQALSELEKESELDKAFSQLTSDIHELIKNISPTELSGATAETNNHEFEQEFIAVTDAIDVSRLPYSGSELFGRDKELKKLDEAWQSETTNIISLIAWGGVGKSTLVNKWLQFLEKDGYRGAKKVFAWSFYSQGTGDQVTSGDEFIFEALTFFGDSEPSAGSAYEKGQRLARLVQKQKTLLLLDGLEPLQAGENLKEIKGRVQDQGIAALMRNLALQNPGLCVISSRVQVKDIERYKEKASVIQLEKLSAEAGRALLRIGGVKGDDKQLEILVQEFGGHALAIGLLPGYLKAFAGHPAEQALVIADLPKVKVRDGKHPRRVIAALYQQLKDEATDACILASELLLLLGLFDRPVSMEALEELIKVPAITGLTDCLSQYGEAGLLKAVGQLRTIQLLAKYSEHQKDKIDCHPIIREHFSNELKDNPDGRKTAHARLYEYYKNLPDKEQPDTVAEMEPLFQAIRHGCFAGLANDALNDVYWARVQRGREQFLAYKLDSFGVDLTLTCITSFFTKPWTELDKTLSSDEQAVVLNWAGFRLRALGRLKETQQPFHTCLNLSLEQSDWKGAAVDASNLSELSLNLGDVKAAISYGKQAMKYANKSADGFQMESKRAVYAYALLAQGEFYKAFKLFTDAEEKQKNRQLGNMFLYSNGGFLFCDYWLSQAEVSNVQERANYAIEIATRENWLLDIALDELSIAKASLAQAIINDATSEIVDALTLMHHSVDDLRKAGDLVYSPKGLLARSQCFIEVAKVDDSQRQNHLHNAWQDLNEVEEIAIPGDMKLYLVDYELSVCRLLYGQLSLEPNKEKYQIWQDGEAVECSKEQMQNRFYQYRDKAEKLIHETGYHRRDAELKNLKEVDISNPDFAEQPRPDWLPPFVNKQDDLALPQDSD